MVDPSRRNCKQKRNGNSMPKLHEYVDEETGEVLRVETTRQAKRRHQKAGGGQWRPTAGQINAADIWNKEEEQIKKKKDREEKRKRNVLKQAQKEAQQKELQQELLRKGKIRIEDTWGKVSASQVRLNKFFAAPSKTSESDTRIEDKRADKTPSEDRDITEDWQRASRGDATAVSDPADKLETILEPDLLNYFTNSPLSQYGSPNDVRKKAVSGLSPFHNRSQTLMPPPPPPPLQRRDSSSVPGISRSLYRPQKSLMGSSEDSSCTRRALGEMSPSQLNARASEELNLSMRSPKAPSSMAQRSHLPLSTQVLSETLDGLGSQDFDDDLEDDKENTQPTSKSHTEFIDRRTTSDMSQPSPPTEYDDSDDATLRDDDSQEDDPCDFDDEDIDDETLISLAATQKIKEDFFHAAQAHATRSESPSEIKIHNPVIGKSPKTTTSVVAAAGDSFAFTDVDDNDLLKCVEAFEDQADEPFNVPAKKRRVMPWVKVPVSEGSQDDSLATSTSFSIYED